MSKLHQVFVYGTLKTGQPNNQVMHVAANGVANLVGTARTVSRYPLVISSRYNIPFLLHRPDHGHLIEGEVYTVDEKMLHFLDVFEGHPDYYTRLEMPVVLSNGETCTPWIYFVKRYRPELCELPTYASYDSNGDHGLKYVVSEQSTVDDIL